MATSVRSIPGVWMSWFGADWNPETPGKEPAGARISARKSGKWNIVPDHHGGGVNWSRELHAVAGVTGEAYGHGFELFDLAPRPGRRLNAHLTYGSWGSKGGRCPPVRQGPRA